MLYSPSCVCPPPCAWKQCTPLHGLCGLRPAVLASVQCLGPAAPVRFHLVDLLLRDCAIGDILGKLGVHACCAGFLPLGRGASITACHGYDAVSNV